jgi:hypothetical protein
MDTKLYESMMLNAGKEKNEIWEDVANSYINNVYLEDYKIYGEEAKEFYKILFPKDSIIFEAIEEELTSLNEVSPVDNFQRGWGKFPRGGMPTEIFDKMNGKTNWGDYPKGGMPPNVFKKMLDHAKIAASQKGSFLDKLKDLFGKGTGLLKQGIAGIIANPLPFIAAGVGVGVIIALIKKFKKLSDEKKKTALAALDKNARSKVELTLKKDEEEIKQELEKKGKSK